MLLPGLITLQLRGEILGSRMGGPRELLHWRIDPVARSSGVYFHSTPVKSLSELSLAESFFALVTFCYERRPSELLMSPTKKANQLRYSGKFSVLF